MLFDPFAPFDSAFGRTWARAGAFIPAADVSVSDSDLVLTLDLPGVTADALELEVLDGHLNIRGERRRPELNEGSGWVHTERAFGRFERRLKLPEGVDPDNITANFEDGVLSLIVPKPERMKPRTITIATGSNSVKSGERKELAAA